MCHPCSELKPFWTIRFSLAMEEPIEIDALGYKFPIPDKDSLSWFLVEPAIILNVGSAHVTHVF